MKQLLCRFPFWSRIFIAIALGIASILLSGIIYNLVPVKAYFPFLAEALLVLATGLLLRTDGQNLSALGLNPSSRNMAYLFWGLGLGVMALLAVSWLRTLYTGETWHFSASVDTMALLKSLYYILPTVVVQELMFRGYLFTKTISRYGVLRANIIFAILFMLVHVLDRDVLQNPAQAIFLAVSIPIGHLWFAAALLRSKTILFPIGLHWGNNWAVQHLIGNTNEQEAIFSLTGQQVYTTYIPFLIMLIIFNGFFLLFTWAIWKGKFTPGKRSVKLL
jgi:membrane protease YdiL (CAAX protease family)